MFLYTILVIVGIIGLTLAIEFIKFILDGENNITYNDMTDKQKIRFRKKWFKQFGEEYDEGVYNGN